MILKIKTSESLIKISSILKQFTRGKKLISSLLYVMFYPLLSKKETPKRDKIKNLSYKALKNFPKLGLFLIRLFSIEELKKDYAKWLKSSPSNKSKKPFRARIDSTKTGKKYGNKIPSIKLLYDYVNHCKIKTHLIYIFVVSLGRKDYIVDFKLVKKKNDGWNKIAKRMIRRFLRSIGKPKKTLKYLRISLDGAWGNGDMLMFLNSKGFKYTAIKSGGNDSVEYKGKTYSLKELENHLSHKHKLFKTFNDCHSLNGDYYSVCVKLKRKDIPIRIVLRRFKTNKSKKPYRYLMLLSTNLDDNLRDYQICKCYEGRWGIEECIKENKQALDLTHYSFHSENTTNIENFLCLRFCLYMVLNWYRVDYCKPSKTSIYKVCNRFKNYFNSIGERAMWKLFSG